MRYHKNQKRLIFFLLFLLLCSYNNVVDAQNGASALPQPIPPSPTAASLGKFGDVPVGYYTGTPNISIPLYEIKTKDLSLPISLSYDANGRRVAQDASWIGLGWSLSAGGVVTRVVRGNDDFGGSGYYNYYNLPWHGYSNNLQEVGQYYHDVAFGVVDSEPDVFSYNFLGYSGKFVIDKSLHGGKVFQSKRDNLDIKFEPRESFTITTPDGTQYYFAIKEVITNLYTDQFTGAGTEPAAKVGTGTFGHASESANSSWYLDRITSPSGDVIHFVYKMGQSLSLISRNEKQFLNLNHYGYDSFGVEVGPLYEAKVDSRQHIEDVILQRIEFSNGRVEFETSDRQDIEAYDSEILPQKLSTIKVYNNNQSSPLKVISFNHSYFEPNEQYVTPHYYEKRLKLDAVQIDQSKIIIHSRTINQRNYQVNTQDR